MINGVVYAELAVRFPSSHELGSYLRASRIEVVPRIGEALVAGAPAWQRYACNRGRRLQSANCGVT